MNPALFVSFSAPETGVFESQVLEYGRVLRRLGVDFRYLLFEGLRTGIAQREALDRRLEDLRRAYGVSIRLRYVPAPLARTGAWLARTRIRREARAMARSPILIQARGAAAACAALGIRGRYPAARILYDARGDEAAEARLEASRAPTPRSRAWWTRRARRMDEMQRRAGAESDHVLAVSGALKERLRALSGIAGERLTVVPCCVDPVRMVRDEATRLDVRRRLGIEDRFVLVYSGSLTTYQIPDRVAALVTALWRREPRAHLLLMTRDRAGAARWFGSLSAAGSTTLVEAPYGRVGDYLAAADAALLLRQDDPVNRVACPVKFAEYVVSGLPVVTTPHVGDLGAYVRETGHGLLIDLDRTADEQAQQVQAALVSSRRPAREDIRARALQVFRREAYLGVYERLLDGLGVLARGDACAS